MESLLVTVATMQQSFFIRPPTKALPAQLCLCLSG